MAAEITICREDGSTASTAILVGNHLYVANVVDSRAVISKAGKASALSDDQTEATSGNGLKMLEELLHLVEHGQ